MAPKAAPKPAPKGGGGGGGAGGGPARKGVWDQREPAARQAEQQQPTQAQTTQQYLAQLKAWAKERLMQVVELSAADAEQAAAYLVTLSTAQLYQWEVEFLGAATGFAQEFVDRQERLGLGTHRGKRDEAEALAAQREARERRQQQQRDGIYRDAAGDADTASVAGSTASGASARRRFKKVAGGLNEIQRMDLLIPGRPLKCDCEARRHKLLQNCINCGKIICEQEGAGPCNFCGLPPSRAGMRGVVTAKQLKQQLETEEDAAEREQLLEMQKSLAHRDRLLHYEQTKAKRTIVIDDQIDYFESTSNQWLTSTERDQAARREADRADAKAERERRGGAYTVELDFGKKTVSRKEPAVGPGEAAALLEQLVGDEATPDYDPDNIFLSPATAQLCAPSVTAAPGDEAEEEEDASGLLVGAKAQRGTRVVAHPGVVNPIRFLAEDERGRKKGKRGQADKAKEPAAAADAAPVPRSCEPERGDKVQNSYWAEDDQLYRVVRAAAAPVTWVYVNSPQAKAIKSEDRGLCLSMHQPWASLLVHGIKRHEGRGWATDHRGKLWIHAAAHQPSPHDVAAVENFYRGRGCQRFPSHYPTSVLLGSVDVTNCLHVDDYKVQIPEPEQESESDYVFICTNFQLLVVPLRMEGKHKIFPLEKIIWQAAKTQAGD